MALISWVQAGTSFQGVGSSGLSYSLMPRAHPEGENGTAWIMLQDGVRGCTFKDKETATFIAGQMESLAYGRKVGYENLEHMDLLDAYTSIHNELDDCAEDEEDELYGDKEDEVMRGLFKDKASIEVAMFKRGLVAHVCRLQ